MKYSGMDIAASEFFKDGKYNFDPKNPESDHADWISSDQLLEMYQGKVKYKGYIADMQITYIF